MDMDMVIIKIIMIIIDNIMLQKWPFEIFYELLFSEL